MTDQKQMTADITEALQAVLGCPVIKANQSAPAPAYPYVSFTVTTPAAENAGTWGEYADGIQRKPLGQVWSFTVQSDDDTQAISLAMRLYEFFDRRNEELSDKGIIVERASSIANRDNFITIQYEHRYGMDVTFSIMREASDAVKSPELVPVKISYAREEGK